MEKQKRIAINIVAQIVSFIVSLGIGFVLTPYIAVKLGTDVYGFVGMAYQVTSYISVFTVAFNAMLGIFVATEYYKQKYEKANLYYTSISMINMMMSIVLIIPFTLIVIFMDSFLDVPQNSVMDIKILWALIFGTFLLNLATGSWGTSLYVKNRIDLGAKRSVESNCIKAIVLLGCFVFLSPKVCYIGIASAICCVYSMVTNYYYWKKLAPELVVLKKYYDFRAVWELLKIGIWNTINQMTNILVSGLDLIVTNKFIGSMAMGYVSYAQTVPTQMVSLISMICSAFSPQLTQVYATSDKEEFKKEIYSAIKVCGFLCSIPILGFIVFGRSFYSLWIPSLTNEEVSKINILSFLILFHTIFDVYFYPLYTVHSITKKVRIPILVSFGMSILNIIFELILIATTDLGVYAIEIATAFLMSLRVLFFTPIYTAYILKLKWYTFYKPLFKGCVSTILVLAIYYGIYKFIPTDSWMKLVIVALFAGIVGYLVNYVVVLDKRDRKNVKTIVKRKLKMKAD